MQQLIGKKVKMTKSCARYTLEHPEMFCVGNSMPQDSFYIETPAAMLCLMGQPIIGTIIREGSMARIYRVDFEVSGLGKFWAYYELGRDVEYV